MRVPSEALRTVLRRWTVAPAAAVVLVLAFLPGALPLAAQPAGEAARPPSDRPNILFLFADDQRADTIRAWGNEWIDTPNLDRLAAEGLSFERNYTFGSNSGAVCVPSRAMVLTGRSWMRSPNDMRGVPTLPRELEAVGYRTFITGKWYNGVEALLRSFDRGTAVYLGGMADHTRVEVQDIEADPPACRAGVLQRAVRRCGDRLPGRAGTPGGPGAFDLFPTLLALGSAQTPPGIDGRDLAALWSGEGDTGRRSRRAAQSSGRPRAPADPGAAGSAAGRLESGAGRSGAACNLRSVSAPAQHDGPGARARPLAAEPDRHAPKRLTQHDSDHLDAVRAKCHPDTDLVGLFSGTSCRV